jgi:hypothetical protein
MKKKLLHGINCLRISVIDLLNITESCYTNFDALFANWSADDKDNLETACRHIKFLIWNVWRIQPSYFGHPITTGGF